MIVGMSTATYTFLHVLISLIGIGSGMVVMYGFLTGKRLDGWTSVSYHHRRHKCYWLRVSL
jgi:hypothetical protein